MLIVGLLGIGCWGLVNQRSGINSATPQSPVTVKQTFQFSDPNSLLSLPDILRMPQRDWQKVSGINFGYTAGTGWSHIKVHNKLTQPVFMELQTHFIDAVKVWLLDSSGILHELPSTGFPDLAKINFNPLKHRYFLAELPMEKNQSYSVIIRGSTTAGFPMKYHVKFWDQPGFVHYINGSNWGWALFIGMVLTIFIVSLAAFIINQKRIYYYFATYIICFSLYALLNDGWGIYLNSAIYEYVNPIQIAHLLSLGICFFLLFSRKFLVIPSPSPKWWLKISPWWFYLLMTILILLTNFGYSHTNSPLTTIGYWCGMAVVVGVLFLWLSYLSDALQRGFQPAWLLLFSQLFILLFFSTNVILVNLHAVFLPLPDMVLLRIALTVQLLLMAVCWIYRQKVIKESQEQLSVLNEEQQQALWEAENRWKDLQIASLSMENELHGQRERLARDLHDGIGSQLTHIISRLDLISINDSSQHNQLLRLRNFTQETNQNLRETIWVLNQKEIAYSEFILRMRKFLGNLWEERSCPVLTWQFPTIMEDLILPPHVAMHLFRISQEALANVIKHAHATKVHVQLEYNSPELFLTIEDNGKGFDSKQVYSGFGLDCMEKRVKEMSGSISIHSEDSGTVIRVRIPLAS